MPKPVAKPKTERALAKKLGVNRSLVGRKRRQGKSDVQIEEESARPSRHAQSLPSETFAEAQRRKEVALADLRELELREKRGELVPRQEVDDVAFRQARAERDGLMNWVNVASPSIAFAIGVDAGAMHRLLDAEVRKFLEQQIEPKN